MVNYIWENIFRRNSEDDQVRDFLRANLLFEDLSTKEIAVILKVVHVRRYRAAEAIFRQGEMGVGMFIVFKGQVAIHVNDHQTSTLDNSTFVTRLTEGDFFGELSLVETNSRRTASAISHQETVLIGFFKPDLKEIIDRYPTIGAKILLRLSEVLGRRLKETTDKITAMRDELRQFEVSHKSEAEHEPISIFKA